MLNDVLQISGLGMEFNYYYVWRHFALNNEIIIFELSKWI